MQPASSSPPSFSLFARWSCRWIGDYSRSRVRGGRSGVHTATYTIKFNQSREICLFGQNRSTYPVQGSRFIRSWKSRMFPNLIQTRQGYEKRKTINNRGGKKGKKKRWIILNKIYKVTKKGKSGKWRCYVMKRSIESIDIKEDFQLRFHSRERTAVLLRGWRDDREGERETERERGRQRRRRKKVGWTRRECRLTDASVARNGESCLPPREVYATPATVLHLLPLNSRNFARGSCTMPTITYAPPLPSLEYACITLSFPSNLLAVYLCKGTHSPCVYTFSSRRNTARSYICRLRFDTRFFVPSAFFSL